jgi:hypothetical protein
LATIDDELVKALICPDVHGKIASNSPIRQLIDAEIVDYDTEVDFGKNRTADILLVIEKDYKQHRLIVELENDRKFDVGEILRKVKRDRVYPAIVVIPKIFEQHAFRFQKSGIPVWYWSAECTWHCNSCLKETRSQSSIMPSKCPNCNKQGTHLLVWHGTKKVTFEEAKENPPIDFEFQSQTDISGSALRIEELLLSPQWVGEVKGYIGSVKIVNRAAKILYGLTANISIESGTSYSRIFEVTLVSKGKVSIDGKPITHTSKKGFASSVQHTWTDPNRSNFNPQCERLRQDDVAILYFPETRPEAIRHSLVMQMKPRCWKSYQTLNTSSQ